MEQIDRTRRYLQRIRDIYSGIPYDWEKKEYLVDDVISFFIHCYHIRDWITELNIRGVTKKNIDKFIGMNEELRVCGDLCNGTKHYELKKHKWTKCQPQLYHRKFCSNGKTTLKDNIIKGKFNIICDTKEYDALELAESCMRLWDEFVKEMRKMPKQIIRDRDGIRCLKYKKVV